MIAFTALLAMSVELAAGYPDRLFRAIGHPVTWIGRLIGALDARLNAGSQRRRRRQARARAGAAATGYWNGKKE